MKNQSNYDKYFFNICVDNFFKNPDKIVEFANKLEYSPDKIGKWPGVRSDPLSYIDTDLNSYIVSKIFRVYYPSNKNQIFWDKSNLRFAKAKSYGDKILNEGWIHLDTSAVAGLIYLTPNANLDSGTNIYQLKNEFKDVYDDEYPCSQKHFFYSNSPEYNYEEYKKQLKENNNKFNLVTKFNNVYNRLISYSGNEYHAFNSFDGFENEERLTLLFFIDGVRVDSPKPYDYIRELDENIESKISKL